MGLDTTHNCWHGPYSSFNRFRVKIAGFIGINLYDYIGFGGRSDWDTLTHKIKPLLNHSDCEGELSVKECEDIVEGLNQILASVPETYENEYYIERMIQFRDGCMEAIEDDEPVEFH